MKRLPGAHHAGGSPGNMAETRRGRVKRRRTPSPKDTVWVSRSSYSQSPGLDMNQLIVFSACGKKRSFCYLPLPNQHLFAMAGLQFQAV